MACIWACSALCSGSSRSSLAMREFLRLRPTPPTLSTCLNLPSLLLSELAAVVVDIARHTPADHVDHAACLRAGQLVQALVESVDCVRAKAMHDRMLLSTPSDGIDGLDARSSLLALAPLRLSAVANVCRNKCCFAGSAVLLTARLWFWGCVSLLCRPTWRPSGACCCSSTALLLFSAVRPLNGIVARCLRGLTRVRFPCVPQATSWR